MIEVYYLLWQALIEGKGLTKNGYRAVSLEFTTVVRLTLSHPSKPDLEIRVLNGKGLRVETDIQYPDGRNVTGTYPHAQMAAEAVLNL